MVKNGLLILRRGKESAENYEWSGHPKEATTHENVELVHSLIMWDRRRSLCAMYYVHVAR